MFEVSETVIFNSLKQGYEKYKALKANDKECEAGKIKGWCLALEEIIKKFAPEMQAELDVLKKSHLEEFYVDFVNLDIPTFLRKRQ